MLGSFRKIFSLFLKNLSNKYSVDYEVKEMYAIIKSGGKQYPVRAGQLLRLETLVAEPGDSVELDQVLLIQSDSGCQFGAPFIEGAKVTAEVQKHGRDKKIRIIKFKRRKHHMKRMGHRQNYTQVKITAINPA